MRGAFVGLLGLSGCFPSNDASSNHPPALEPVRVVTEEDRSETFRIVVHDRDGDLLDLQLDGAPVTIRRIEQSVDAEGTRLEATAVYRARANFNGVEPGLLSVSDGIDDMHFELELEVLPVNDYPVARADAFAMAPDSPLAIPVAVVLRNDDDDADRYLPEGAEDDVLRIGRLQKMSHGTVELVADTLMFTPRAGLHRDRRIRVRRDRRGRPASEFSSRRVVGPRAHRYRQSQCSPDRGTGPTACDGGRDPALLASPADQQRPRR